MTNESRAERALALEDESVVFMKDVDQRPSNLYEQLYMNVFKCGARGDIDGG